MLTTVAESIAKLHIAHLLLVFTARCAIVQSAVLRLHVVCLSVTLVDQDHISW